MSTLLNVSDLAVSYGHIAAVRGVNFTLEAGEITALVGANGAGKTTTLLALSGLLRAQRGSIMFDGQDLQQLAPHRIVRQGVVQVPEGRAILATLTVRENLDLGAFTRRDRAAAARDLEWVFSLFPVLKDRASGFAGNLSGGEQQMLAIGRALMTRPRLLLLDEPSMGIAPILVQRIYETIAEINRGGVTILLVEQNANYALDVSQRGYVMETGRVVIEGESDHLRTDPQVQRAYLGA